jgi:hypothetical protein
MQNSAGLPLGTGIWQRKASQDDKEDHTTSGINLKGAFDSTGPYGSSSPQVVALEAHARGEIGAIDGRRHDSVTINQRGAELPKKF